MGKSFQKRLNHVIFLGAGASASSGYPIGQELRLRMASQKHFDEELKKHIRLDLVLPEHFRNAENRLHPSSLRGRVAEIFRDVAPDMKYVRSSSEDDGMLTDKIPESSYNPDITARYSFKEFIEREMD
jgi:hypothetical protein